MVGQATGFASVHNRPLNDVLIEAFDDACRRFKAKHGREPNIDLLSFRGGFSTVTAVFEIWEDD